MTEALFPPQHAVTDDGFTEWVSPKPDSYLMKCCDCGLVHELQFRVAKYEPRPSENHVVVDDPDLQAQFRARRGPQQPNDFTAAYGARPSHPNPLVRLLRRINDWSKGSVRMPPANSPGQVAHSSQAHSQLSVNSGAEMARPDEQNPVSRSSLPNRSVLPREPL